MLEREILGIYLDETNIEMVCLRRTGRRWKSVAPPFPETDATYPVAERLKRALMSVKPSRRRKITIGLPRKAYFIRELPYPQLTEDEALSAVRLGIGLHVHLEPKEILHDAAAFSREGETFVLLGYARRSYVEPVLKVLKETGHEKSLGTVAPATLGLDILLRLGKARFPCTAMGDQNGTRVLSLHGPACWEGAHVYKDPPTGNPEESLDAMAPGIPPGFRKLLASPSFGVGNVPGFAPKDPCSLDNLSTLSDRNGKTSWGLCAAALGIPSFPLLSFQDGTRKKPLHLRLHPTQMAAAAAALVILLATGIRWSELQGEKHDLEVIQKKVQELETSIAPFRENEKEIAGINNLMEDIQQFRTAKAMPLKVLLAIALEMPDHTWIRSLNLEKDKARITAEGTSALETITALKKNPLFSDVIMVSPVTKTNEQKERFSAELILATAQAPAGSDDTSRDGENPESQPEPGIPGD